MNFSNLALTKLAVAAILPQSSMAGLRGGGDRRLTEEETPVPSQAPSSADDIFDVSAVLEVIFDDELSENHQEPEYEYIEETEELIVLPPRGFLSEEWHVYSHDGSDRMNQTVFFEEFVADIYPDTIFDENSMGNIWNAYSQGQEYLERDSLVNEDDTNNSLCTEDIEPHSVCLVAKFQMVAFPDPMSDEEAMELYSDLVERPVSTYP